MNTYQQIREKITSACLACGRDVAEVQLVAVTKSVDWQEAALLYAQGQRHFAENRLQQALDKKALSPPDCCWHLIGTLQSNKVRKAIGQFSLIHAVDSVALARKISTCSQDAGLCTAILLQVNTSGEAAKHGMTSEQCLEAFEELLSLPSLSIQGLMTMAPLVEDEAIIRKCFADLRRLRDQLNARAAGRIFLHHLSMGMSHDFPLAIAEGATLLRIGTALFNRES